MKLGFQLSGTTKRKKVIETTDEDTEIKKEYLNKIEDSKICSLNGPDEKKPLVIPLLPSRNVSNVATSSEPTIPSIQKTDTPLTLDEQAAQALLSELHGEPGEGGAKLVISQNSSSSTKAAPLLLANVPAELANCSNDDERFKIDISLRAENVDVTSDIYQAVPIEEFGAALLRGMGWAGYTKEEEEALKNTAFAMPREQRLGLGATPKPPEPVGKRADKRKQDKVKNETNKWQKLAQEKLASQQLNVEDIVWLRDPQYAGRRAQIKQITGVPGLSKIRVQLEGIDGKVIDIARSDVVLISKDELNEKPFVASNVPVLTNEMEFLGEKNSGKKESRKESANENPNHIKLSKKRVASPPPVDKRSRKEDCSSWVRSGIRVRLVNDRHKHHLKKGRVLDVCREGDKYFSTIELDNGSVLEGVKEKYLENVLPSVNDTCLILRGRHKGSYGKLIEKIKEKDLLIVQLTDEMSEICELGLDDAAALA